MTVEDVQSKVAEIATAIREGLTYEEDALPDARTVTTDSIYLYEGVKVAPPRPTCKKPVKSKWRLVRSRLGNETSTLGLMAA